MFNVVAGIFILLCFLIETIKMTMILFFFVYVDSPRDSVQFIEWSPTSCPRALLIANFHGRITIWTQPTQVSSLMDVLYY